MVIWLPSFFLTITSYTNPNFLYAITNSIIFFQAFQMVLKSYNLDIFNLQTLVQSCGIHWDHNSQKWECAWESWKCLYLTFTHFHFMWECVFHIEFQSLVWPNPIKKHLVSFVFEKKMFYCYSWESVVHPN